MSVIKSVSLNVVALIAGLLLMTSGMSAQTPITLWLDARTPEVTEWAEVFEARFNRENPDIQLQVDSELGLRRDRLVVATASGLAPDIYTEALNVLGSVAQNGLAHPLDEFYDRYAEYDDLNAQLVRDTEYGGQRYALPINLDGYVDVYNRAMFTESGLDLPSDWESLTTVARQLTRVNAEGEIEVYGYQADNHPWNSMIALHRMMTQLGRPLIGPDDTRLDLQNEVAREALGALVDLWDAGMPGVTNQGIRTQRRIDEIAAGRAAVQHGLAGRLLMTSGQVGASQLVDWEYRQMVGPNPGEGVTEYNGAILVMHPHTKAPDAAWRVMEAFLEPENYLGYLRAYQGVYPVRRSLMFHPDLVEGFPVYEEIAHLLDPIISAGPLNAGYVDFRGEAGAQIRRVFTEGLGISEALAEAERIANAILAER